MKKAVHAKKSIILEKESDEYILVEDNATQYVM